MLAPAPPAPARLVARAMTGFMLASGVARARPHGGDFLQSMGFNTIVTANLAGLPPGSADPIALSLSPDAHDPVERRPVSVNAVARSLGVPYETMRARVQRLVALEMVVSGRGGIVAPVETLRRPEFQQSYLETYLAFAGMLQRLAALGLDMRAMARAAAGDIEPPSSPPPPALVVRIAIAAQLRFMEAFTRRFDDLTRGLVWAGVILANVRHLEMQPRLAWRYAAQHAPPPDEERLPVSVRGLARDLELPFETVRRHVLALIASDVVEVVPGQGVRVPARVMEAGTTNGDANPLVLAQFVRMLAILHRLGFVLPVATPWPWLQDQDVSTSSRVAV